MRFVLALFFKALSKHQESNETQLTFGFLLNKLIIWNKFIIYKYCHCWKTLSTRWSAEVSWYLQLSQGDGEGSEVWVQGIGSIHHRNPTPLTRASSIRYTSLAFLTVYPRSWQDTSPVLAVCRQLRCRNQGQQSLLGWKSAWIKRSPLHKRRALACSGQPCKTMKHVVSKYQMKRNFIPRSNQAVWQHRVPGLALGTAGELRK